MSSAKSYAKAYLAATTELGAELQVAWLLVLASRGTQRTMTRILQESDAEAQLKSLDVPSPVGQFLKVLAEDRALKRLSAIAEQGLALCYATELATPVRVASASELGPDELALLTKGLESSQPTPIVMATTIQPKLLGGMRLSIGGKQLDYSVAGRLAALHTHLRTQ